MITNLTSEIIDAFNKLRKVYLIEKFENSSEGTEDILKDNAQNEDYLIDIKNGLEYHLFLEELKSKVDELWINRDSLAKILKERILIVREKVLINSKLIKNIIDAEL